MAKVTPKETAQVIIRVQSPWKACMRDSAHALNPLSVLMRATPLEPDHTQTSHSFQYEEQSRNWSALLMYMIPPGKEPVVFLNMEIKWVQPVSTDHANIRGFKIDNDPINLDATSFRWAVQEAVYQTLWYLYAAGKFCETSLAVAQVNEFSTDVSGYPTAHLL